MLVAGGGGGAGGTPWGMLTIQGMQELIQNPDTERHYELLTGWKRSADLLVEHQWQVRNYRDNLAAAWPPEKNAASAAYIARLDELITNLTETYEAALSNHDAFAAATLSISLAQKEMNELAREYQSNELMLADFTAKQQNASGQPQPTPSPSGEQPPVAPGRQQELYQKAVTLLSGVSADLAQAQVRISTPRPYTPENRRDDPVGGEGGTYIAPAIPPISPSYSSEASTPASSSRSAVTFPSSGSATTPPAPQQPAPQPGLILGGASPPPAAIPASGIVPALPSSPVGPIGLTPPPGPFAPTPRNFTPGGRTLAPPPMGPIGRNVGPPHEGVIRPGGPPPGSARAMPPGGLIGGAPGVGIAPPGSARTASQRVNPVGGVIGSTSPSGGKSASASTSGQHSGSGGPYGQGGRGISKRDQEEQSRWDPDNPWHTASGVDPVVLPPRDQRIDPGPAIGLS